jgi:hypothetical protein
VDLAGTGGDPDERVRLSADADLMRLLSTQWLEPTVFEASRPDQLVASGVAFGRGGQHAAQEARLWVGSSLQAQQRWAHEQLKADER